MSSEVVSRVRTELESIVKAVVNDGHAVRIDHKESSQGKMIFTIKTAPGDIRYLLGKKGRTIQALRTIFMGIGARNHLSIVLDVNEG